MPPGRLAMDKRECTLIPSGAATGRYRSAVSLSRDNGLPIIVFKMRQRGNIVKVIMGERVGSRVCGDPA